ncbi:hypothetical protein ABG067_006581 [Albugo candida]
MHSIRARIPLLLAIALSIPSASTSRIDDLSFNPPFTMIDYYGDLELNDTWRSGGSSVVKKNFVRLQPASATYRGWIWSEDKIKRNTLSMVATVRLSGNGDGKQNEGVGFWFTEKTSSPYSNLKNFGFSETYQGFGVIIRQVTTQSTQEKMISIQHNDGSRQLSDLDIQRLHGCDAVVWHDEKSADFNPAFSQSRLKILIDGLHVSVHIDATSEGRWTSCQEFDLPTASDWLATSTFGITSGVGPSNYTSDIISLNMYTDVNDDEIQSADTQAIVHSMSKSYDGWLDSPSCGVDCMVAVLRKSVANLHVDVEHRLMDLKEGTTHLVDELRAQERENEYRVSKLERELKNLISTKLEQSHGDIKSQITAKIDEEWKNNSALGDHGWKGAFMIAIVAIGVFGFLLYRKYRALMKSHLL